MDVDVIASLYDSAMLQQMLGNHEIAAKQLRDLLAANDIAGSDGDRDGVVGAITCRCAASSCAPSAASPLSPTVVASSSAVAYLALAHCELGFLCSLQLQADAAQYAQAKRHYSRSLALAASIRCHTLLSALCRHDGNDATSHEAVLLHLRAAVRIDDVRRQKPNGVDGSGGNNTGSDADIIASSAVGGAACALHPRRIVFRDDADDDDEHSDDARRKLAMYLCQRGADGDDAEAGALLTQQGFKYRLSSDVLCYDVPPTTVTTTTTMTTMPEAEDNAILAESGAYLQVWDNVLSLRQRRYLQRAFARTSPFWREHQYTVFPQPTPYFSYMYNVRDDIDARDDDDVLLSTTTSASSSSSSSSSLSSVATTPPSDIMLHAIIRHLYRHARRCYPERMQRAKYAEWWAHTRPHSSGHQLHFDSDDEGRNGVRNPILSGVVYTTAGVGGPTLVTDQYVHAQTMARRGWLCHSSDNRFCLFDGRVLHGVVPGRGYSMAATSSSSTTTDDGTLQPHADAANDRRQTWMVAFWDQDYVIRGTGTDPPGPSRVLPTVDDPRYTWPSMLANIDGNDADDDVDVGMKSSEASSSAPVRITPVVCSTVWQSCAPETAAGDGTAAAAVADASGADIAHYDRCFQGF